MLDVELADDIGGNPDIEGIPDIDDDSDDMGGIPDIEGIPDIDDDSDAILDMDGIGGKEFAAFETLLPGIEPVIGSFMDIRGMEVIKFELLSAAEVVEGLFIDIEGIEDIGFAASTTLLCGIEPII